MSLLDTASLLLTPNAYKEGKLYSVIPSDGSGDFTFTRATTATRVNSDGLVELVPYNLLTYSNAFSNVAWTKTASTITSSQVDPNGGTSAFKLVEDTSTSFHRIFIGYTMNLGTTYTISVTAKASGRNLTLSNNVALGGTIFDLTNGTIVLQESNVTNASMTSLGNGWYRCQMTSVGDATGAKNAFIGLDDDNVFNAYTGNGTSGVFIYEAQLVEGSAALPYQKTETRLNIPRLDYSNGTCPSILLEPQRTNLLQQSSSFDNAAWNKINTTITANDTTAPDNTQTADLVNLTGASGRVITSVTFTAAPYTFSTFVKYASQTDTLLRVFDGTTTFTLTLSWSGGVPSFVSNTGSAYNIQNYGDGWYRVSLTCTTAAAAGTVQIYPNGFNSSGTAYLWGAQLEAGSYATSYIPTTTASVTRNAEVLSKTGISALIGQDEGTVYTELYWEGPREASADIIALMSNTTNYFRFFIRPSNGSFPNAIEIVRVKTGETLASVRGSSLASAQTLKIAVVYSLTANTLKMYVNGSVYIDTTLSYLPSMSWIKLGSSHIDTNQFGNGIKSTALWQFAATDAELAQLTTI